MKDLSKISSYNENPLEKDLPLWFRNLTWIVLIITLFFTATVWIRMFMAYRAFTEGKIVSLADAAFLLIGYHFLLLVMSLINAAALSAWKSSETVGFFGLAMILCTVTIGLSGIMVLLSL